MTVVDFDKYEKLEKMLQETMGDDHSIEMVMALFSTMQYLCVSVVKVNQ